MNDETIKPVILPNEKVSVCPHCYEYLTVKQQVAGTDEQPEEAPVVWVYFCPRCKRDVDVPKMMDIAERQYLNVRAMRKAKEA